MSSGASRVKISTASWSARKSEPLTVSKACVSAESGPAFPSAALMPPSAAPEWLRVGCSFEMTPTFAPASCASIAARMPAQPAPTTRTSCVDSTARTLPKRRRRSRRVLQRDEGGRGVPDAEQAPGGGERRDGPKQPPARGRDREGAAEAGGEKRHRQRRARAHHDERSDRERP